MVLDSQGSALSNTQDSWLNAVAAAEKAVKVCGVVSPSHGVEPLIAPGPDEFANANPGPFHFFNLFSGIILTVSEIIQTYSDLIRAYLEIHVSLAPLISMFLRTLAIVVAPIPGTPIDLINLAFFSKMAGFIYAEISVMLGSSINFYIGRKFGEPVVKKFIDVGKIHIWEQRINEKSGFWGLVFIRMGTVLIFDYLSYVAGLTKISFSKFFTTSLLASIPPLAAFYYFGGMIIEKEMFVAITLIVPFIVLFSLFRKGKIFKRFHDYLDIEKINGFLNGGQKEDKNMK